MNIDGAILDLDGTLLDSMPIWDTVGEDYLRSRGIAPRPELNEKLKTMSLQQAVRCFQSEYGLTDSEEAILAGINGLIEDFYLFTAPLKEGVPVFLESLRQRGVKLCIATATERYLVEGALYRNGVLAYFNEIFTCGAVGHGKDEPQIYEAALRFLGTPQDTTWVFEDMLYAVRTAKAAGFPVVGVYEAWETQPEELQALSDLYILSFREMEDYL